MLISTTPITTTALAMKACQFTSGKKPNDPWELMKKLYTSEHSPLRTQLWWVEMYDIPTFVSVHFVRHKIGVEHFVKSNRDDRGGEEKADRNTPVNHAMLANAQALINMARVRLCMTAHEETRKVMKEIRKRISTQDALLADVMVRNCVYRGMCPEDNYCSLYGVVDA